MKLLHMLLSQKTLKGGTETALCQRNILKMWHICYSLCLLMFSVTIRKTTYRHIRSFKINYSVLIIHGILFVVICWPTFDLLRSFVFVSEHVHIFSIFAIVYKYFFIFLNEELHLYRHVIVMLFISLSCDQCSNHIDCTDPRRQTWKEKFTRFTNCKTLCSKICTTLKNLFCPSVILAQWTYKQLPHLLPLRPLPEAGRGLHYTDQALRPPLWVPSQNRTYYIPHQNGSATEGFWKGLVWTFRILTVYLLLTEITNYEENCFMSHEIEK